MKTTEASAPNQIGKIMLAWLWTHRDGGTPSELTREFSMVPLGFWSAADRRRVCGETIDAMEKAGWIVRKKNAKRKLLRRTLTDAGQRVLVADPKIALLPRKATWKMLKPRLFMLFFIELMFSAASAPASLPVSAGVDLPEQDDAFAKLVLASARASKTGRFGSGKVFISHVARQLEKDGFRVGDDHAFKGRLVAVHRKQLLSLSRADLVEAMDPKDVDASEASYMSSTFHFVRI